MEQLCWLTQLMSRKILSQWSRKLVRRESRSFAVVQLLNWMLSSQKWMAACRSNLLTLTLVLYFSTLSQKAVLIPTSPFFQSLLSQQGKWMNSRLDSRNSMPLLKMAQEQVELFTMVLVLLVTVFTAEKDSRMPRLLQSTEQISSLLLKSQLRLLELVT